MKIKPSTQKILKLFIVLFCFGCSTGQKENIPTNENGYAILSDDQVENIVKRSYQYVALYNVTNKFALNQGGWNTLVTDTKLKDHTMTDIARPNNDSFYSSALLDLRAEPIVLDLPAFDSKYVSLMVTAYDHYVDVPKATRKGDFEKPEKILFYSENTEGYDGEDVPEIDEIYKTTGDFVSAVFRIMPHASDEERFKRIVETIGDIKIQPLSEFNGAEPKVAKEITFPEVGKTDLDVFENNLLEVMQFIFNHISLDPKDKLDQKVLEAYKPLGVAPGNVYGQDNVEIDGKKFRAIAEKVQQENFEQMGDPEMEAKKAPLMFKTKGLTDLQTLVSVSVLGPIGLPMEEAMYLGVTSSDGTTMNAMNDYVVKMTKDELPPDQAFWSLTLYDKVNGFFIPNDKKKYSVGENGGFKLNENGGIEIYVAVEKPADVPEENWLPINRIDEEIDLVLRIYVPDLNKMKTWKAPEAVKL